MLEFGDDCAIRIASILMDHSFFASTVNGNTAFGKFKFDGFAKWLHFVGVGPKTFSELVEIHVN